MVYKEMGVWCCGDNKASLFVKRAVIYGALVILTVFIQGDVFIGDSSIKSYTASLTQEGRIILELLILLVTDWMLLLICRLLVNTLRTIRLNKLISLRLFDSDMFEKLDGIPEGKVVLFQDEDGVVLVDREFEKEGKVFSSDKTSYKDFVKYFFLRAYSKELIENGKTETYF